MKTAHFLLLTLSLSGFAAVEPPGADEYQLGMKFSGNCANTQIARATCLQYNKKPVSCRAGEEDELTGGALAIVKCGGSAEISAFCMPYAKEFVQMQRCQSGGVVETTSAFNARVACYAEDVKAMTLAACPVGCEKYTASLRNIHVCDWTVDEYNNYRSCGIPLEASLFREKGCPNGRQGVDSVKGGPPALNTSGDTVSGPNGQKLFRVYYQTFRLQITSTRGGVGKLCIYPKGQSCTNEETYDGSSSVRQISGMAPGTYIITATSAENSMSSSLEVSVSDKYENNDFCQKKSGTFCSKNLRETEYVNLCGGIPEGDWTPQGEGNYHRLTGNSCVAGQRTEVVSVVPMGNTPTAGTQQASTQSKAVGNCDYWNFTSPDGSYTSHKLGEGSRVIRKIVSSDGKGLVDQTVTCVNGVLADVSTAPAPSANTEASNLVSSGGKQCDYWNFTSIQGAYTAHKLNDGGKVTRKIIAPGGVALIDQVVVCKNGVLADAGVPSAPSVSVQTTPSSSPSPVASPQKQCDYFNYTSIDGKYTTSKLNEGGTVVRKLVSPDKKSLVDQTIICKNGVLADVTHLK